MVKKTAKKSIGIRPARIDNELLVKVGQILREECPKKHEVSVTLSAESIESEDAKLEDYKEFADIDIPSDTYFIQMTVHPEEGPWENHIEIEVDFERPQDSRIRIEGVKTTWVKGVAQRLADEFDKKRLSYRYIAEHAFVRIAMSWVSSAFLAYLAGYALWFAKFDFIYIALFVVGFFFVMVEVLKRFYNWVFPYFEVASDDFKPRRFRKIACVILGVTLSGVPSAILQRLLGF